MATVKSKVPLARWLALSMLLGLPLLLVLGLAVMRAALSWREALLIGLPAFAVHLAFAYWHSRTVRRALERAEGILSHEPRPPSSWDAWTMLGELDATVERLRRHLLSEKGQVALQSTTADAILSALPDPLLVLDQGRRVTRANHAARRLFGNEMVGQDLSLALRHPAALEAVDAVLAGQEALIAVDFTLPTAEGRSFSLRVAALPVVGNTAPDATPKDMAAVLALHDITALQKAERMRADFVANASHELRTPLASLVGFIETLLGPARDDEPARIRFLGIMRDQAARMARLINDLLSLSQIEMREHDRPRDAVALAPLLRDLAEGLQPQAAAKSVTLRLELDETAPPALGARDELSQVFQNLIDNAVKYGRNGSQVTVALRRHDELGLEVSITDQGEGIPKQHLPRLTERFYRVDSARSRELGGTGLGLAIVKHIVSRHRGRLVIESEVGIGSVFSIRLPFVR
ncbi:ATP-binding protein [Ferrovibrio sp.]|uniref:ATP-binding protein n=1 Tax=Ferrovibrio sp. TaxID=1917215 RepID=UPI001B610D48|nr:ATP-binding protein [Ferrovibrio sp.]MBP7065616.1 PAS domain-containing protein [Ferrovibrio sp.]